MESPLIPGAPSVARADRPSQKPQHLPALGPGALSALVRRAQAHGGALRRGCAAATLVGVLVGGGTRAEARPFRVSQIPNGAVAAVRGCGTCHTNPNGGGARNPFGQEVERGFLSAQGAAGNVRWQRALAELDSDRDGRTNGAELLDPLGTWTIGSPNPGSPAAVTNPGVPDAAAASVPLTSTGTRWALGAALAGVALLQLARRPKTQPSAP